MISHYLHSNFIKFSFDFLTKRNVELEIRTVTEIISQPISQLWVENEVPDLSKQVEDIFRRHLQAKLEGMTSARLEERPRARLSH